MTESKIALVTGASRGIGAAIAKHLAAASYTVVGTATSESGADQIKTMLGEVTSAPHAGMVLNQSSRESLEALVQSLTEKEMMPDVLVNNAGITRDHLFIKLKPEQIDEVIQTNLAAVIHLTQSCVRGMIRKKWGRVIHMGSVVGSTGNPGQTSYAAAKAGLLGFSRSLGLEVASRGITVNTVSPGFIDTDMTRVLNDKQRELIMAKIPMKRLGSVDDIASAVGFLVSDGAAYVTGQNIHINGGMYLS